MKLVAALILAVFFCGCTTEQFFYAKNFRDVQDLRIPGRVTFDRYDTVAVVASGSGYVGKELSFEVHRTTDGRLFGQGHPGVLASGKLAVDAFPDLPAGHYHVYLFVDRKFSRAFDITVAK